MKKIRVFFAILAGKAVKLFCRIVRKGGTAMPGRFALKIYPGLLKELAGEVKTVTVTGTNGKTTCCRMVEEAFSQAGLDYFANRSGANLDIGIATDFISNCTLGGRMKKHYAVIECDEGAARKVFGQLQPTVILVTNLFNDQLDRFGTVKNTLQAIRDGIKGAPGAVLCLNADEPLSASLADNVPNKAVFYGLESSAVKESTPAPDSDEAKCVVCGSAYDYSYVSLAHLGGFCCPSCGYSRRAADYAVTAILDEGFDSSTVTLRCPDGVKELNVNLPARYNIYNAAATVAAAVAAGIDSEAALRAPAVFQCGFGRMERFSLGKAGARMILVKNTAGINQVIHFISGIQTRYSLSLCCNNRVSDGTDFSWINDAEFERLSENAERIKHIFVSGDRIRQAKERLLNAGFSADIIFEEPDYDKLFDRLSEEDVPVYIMPTYTAMIEFRDVLIKRLGGTQFFAL